MKKAIHSYWIGYLVTINKGGKSKVEQTPLYHLVHLLWRNITVIPF